MSYSFSRDRTAELRNSAGAAAVNISERKGGDIYRCTKKF